MDESQETIEINNLAIKELEIEGYEKVIHAKNPSVGLNSFIAIHSTRLGPALGGTRIYPFHTEEAALIDVLRLSKGMTYKTALLENGLGGGKSVIIADPKTEKTEELLLAFAEAVNFLEGKYIAAEDVGTRVEDMAILRKKTPYVCALPSRTSSGDPSIFTARGIYMGIKAVVKTLWNSNMKGKKIAIQGLGNVGSKLIQHLFWEEAELFISDLDKEQMKTLAHIYGATIVKPEEILTLPCDVIAPCALGGVISKEIITKLRCEAIAGSSNNQLQHDDLGKELVDKGILYAPDFVINAGGVINAASEFEEGGYDPKKALRRVNRIYDTLLAIFETSKKTGKPTNIVANELAEYKLQNNIGKRSKPIKFT